MSFLKGFVCNLLRAHIAWKGVLSKFVSVAWSRRVSSIFPVLASGKYGESGRFQKGPSFHYLQVWVDCEKASRSIIVCL